MWFLPKCLMRIFGANSTPAPKPWSIVNGCYLVPLESLQKPVAHIPLACEYDDCATQWRVMADLVGKCSAERNDIFHQMEYKLLSICDAIKDARIRSRDLVPVPVESLTYLHTFESTLSKAQQDHEPKSYRNVVFFNDAARLSVYTGNEETAETFWLFRLGIKSLMDNFVTPGAVPTTNAQATFHVRMPRGTSW